MSEGVKKSPPPTPLFVLRGSESSVYSLSFDRDSRRLASGSGNGSLMIWDCETKRCTLRIGDAHCKAVGSLHWGGGGTEQQHLWTQGRDGLIKQWDLLGAEPRCVSGHHVGCEGFVPMSVADGGTMAALPDPNDLRGIVMLNLANKVEVMHQWSVPESYGMCMRLSVTPQGYVFAVYEGAKMGVWNITSGSSVWQGDVAGLGSCNDAKATCTAVCVDSSSSKGAVGSNGCNVVPFTFDGAHVLWEDAITMPRPGMSHLVYRRRDARILAGAGWDGNIRLWSGKHRHKPLCVCSFHSGIVHCVDWGGGGLFAAGGDDKRISLWDLYGE